MLGVQAKLKQADTIYSFYVVLCDHFFEEVCVEETESVHLSLLAYSIEVVTYASQLTLMNSPIHFSEKDLKFEEIFTVLQPDPLDLWLVGATLQNTDAQMPQKLRNYLKDLETLLLKEHIWTSLPLIERIQRLVLQEEEDKDELLQLVAAVLDSVEALIQRITREFVCELGEQQEKIHE